MMLQVCRAEWTPSSPTPPAVPLMWPSAHSLQALYDPALLSLPHYYVFKTYLLLSERENKRQKEKVGIWYSIFCSTQSLFLIYSPVTRLLVIPLKRKQSLTPVVKCEILGYCVRVLCGGLAVLDSMLGSCLLCRSTSFSNYVTLTLQSHTTTDQFLMRH